MSYPTTLMISWFNVRNAKIGTPHPSVYVLILIICELDKLECGIVGHPCNVLEFGGVFLYVKTCLD